MHRNGPFAKQPIFPVVKWGIMLGVAISVTQILMQAAMNLPAVIAFPLIQGLSLMGGVMLMSWLYREKFNRHKTIGVFLGLTVIVLSVFRY
jgi:multidrug transporter EmrE-like cation transporter